MTPHDFLNKAASSAMKDANNSEYDLLRQLVIIDSGAIALVGALVYSNKSSGIALPLQIMLTIALACLAMSIITAIIQYLVTRKYFTKLYNGYVYILNTLPNSTEKAQGDYLLKEEKERKLRQPGSTVPMWMSVISFLAGAIVLVAVIVVLVW